MTISDNLIHEILLETKELNQKATLLAEQWSEIPSMYHRENKAVLSQIADYLRDYQGIIDYAIAGSYNRESLLRELKREITKAAKLLAPELVGLSRVNNSTNQSNPAYPANHSYSTKTEIPMSMAYYKIAIGFLANVSQSNYQAVDEGYSTDVPVPQNIQLVSSSECDTRGGTGINSVVVGGLNANRQRICETVILNGIIPVNTVNQFSKLDTLYANCIGTNGCAAGEITMTNPANTVTYGHIGSGFKTWRSGRYYTDIQTAAYIHQWSFSWYNASASAELRASNTAGFSLEVNAVRASSANNSFHAVFPIPIRVPQQGIVYTRALAKGRNSEVNTSYSLYITQE